MTYLQIIDHAGPAYAALAPHYDRFTAGYPYENWLAQIESRALACGLVGRRALDIGCGTGKSFAPLLARGYSVSACDLSAESRMTTAAGCACRPGTSNATIPAPRSSMPSKPPASNVRPWPASAAAATSKATPTSPSTSRSSTSHAFDALTRG